MRVAPSGRSAYRCQISRPSAYTQVRLPDVGPPDFDDQLADLGSARYRSRWRQTDETDTPGDHLRWSGRRSGRMTFDRIVSDCEHERG